MSNLGEGEFEGKAILIQRQSTGKEPHFKSTSEGLKRVAVRGEFGKIPVFAGAITVLSSDLSRGEPSLAGWLDQNYNLLRAERSHVKIDFAISPFQCS